MVDWSGLPKDIVVLIAKRMQTGSDVRHFRSVCTSWRSSVPPPKPPRCLKIPTYDPHVADHIYLLERTIYYVESPHRFYFVKVEEDEHGKMHLLHPLTNSKIKSSVSQMVLDCLNLHLLECDKENVLRHKPKNQASCEALEYDDESKLAFKRVAFNSSSRDSENFELLVEHFLGGLVLFKSADMQWTRLESLDDRRDYHVFSFSGRLRYVSESRDISTISYQRRIFMIQSASDLLIKVEICPSLEHYSWYVGQFDCFKPNGERVSFRISFFSNKDWKVLYSLGDLVLFLGINCSFFQLSSHHFKGDCIVFSKPTWEPTSVRGQYTHQLKGHDIYVADLKTRQILPLEHSPGYSNLFRPPSDPFTLTTCQSSEKVLLFQLSKASF